MVYISWLHLSDLHFLHLTEGTNRSRLEDSLKECLKGLNIIPDLIFVTGDIAFGEVNPGDMARQYRSADSFLKGIIQIYQPNISEDKVFIVPGNHDINRETRSRAEKEYLGGLDLEKANKIYMEMETELNSFQTATNEYRKFLKDSGFQHLLDGDSKRLRYAIKVDLNGVVVGIAGFNSAWSSFQNKEKGKLFFCRDQIEWAKEKLKDSQLKIALAHHPWNWLHEHEEKIIQNLIKEDFHFFLHGHEHYSDIEHDYERKFVKIDAGATYQGENGDNTFYTMKLPVSGEDALVEGFIYKERSGVSFVRDVTDSAPDGKRLLKDLSVNKLLGNPDLIKKTDLGQVGGRKAELEEDFIAGSDERRGEAIYWSRFKPFFGQSLIKIKQELGIKELSLVFLPERDGHSIPEIGEWERYEEVKKFTKHTTFTRT